MTATARLTALAALPFLAVWELVAALLCPVTIGAVGSLIFTPDSTFYAALKIVCFVWGAWQVYLWWSEVQALTHAITRAPRQARRPRRTATRR